MKHKQSFRNTWGPLLVTLDNTIWEGAHRLFHCLGFYLEFFTLHFRFLSVHRSTVCPKWEIIFDFGFLVFRLEIKNDKTTWLRFLFLVLKQIEPAIQSKFSVNQLFIPDSSQVAAPYIGFKAVKSWSRDNNIKKLQAQPFSASVKKRKHKSL